METIILKLGKDPFPSEQKSSEQTVGAATDDQEKLYLEFLEKAKREDFSEFKKLGAIYSPGRQKKNDYQ